MSIRVVVAEVQPLLRLILRLLIGADPSIDVVGEAANGQEAVCLARRQRADIVLMDIRMPQVDGIQATKLITTENGLSHVKIIILTALEPEELVVAALRAGASGYVSKGAEPAVLLSAIRTVVAGDALLFPTSTRALIARVLVRPHAKPTLSPARLEELTPREREILTLVALGLSNEEISGLLRITLAAARLHVDRMLAKLNVHARPQLVIAAYEAGLVPDTVPKAENVSRRSVANRR